MRADRVENAGIITWPCELLLFSGASRVELIRRLEQTSRLAALLSRRQLRDLAYTLNTADPEGAWRCAVIADAPHDTAARIAALRDELERGKPQRVHNRAGAYYFADPPARSAKLAFLFPGDGAQYPNMLADICMAFPEVRQWFDLMDRAFVGLGWPRLPSEWIFGPSGAEGFAGAPGLSESVFAASQGLLALASRLGLKADVMVGHCAGDCSALIASGALSVPTPEEQVRCSRALQAIFRQAPEGVLLSVAAEDRQAVRDAVRGGTRCSWRSTTARARWFSARTVSLPICSPET